jgi:predicted flavoprotein YhiN
LSRYLVPGAVISIDLLPEIAQEDLRKMLAERCASLDWRTADTLFAGMLHDRVARAIMRAAGVGVHTPVVQLPVARLAAVLKDFRLQARGMGDASQAQVTRGGASVAEFDPDTMASRLVDGLFAAGELLDIDGRSGGFNLHWAWASGIVAGEAAARFAAERVSQRGAGPGGSA